MYYFVKLRSLLRKTIIDDIAMASLAVFSVVLLVVETNTSVSTSRSKLYDALDLIVALIFLSEWFVRFFASSSKAAFVKSNWWELLASIPITSNFAQALRALRILRIVRIVRLATRLKRVSNFSKTLAKHDYVIQILLVFLSITFVASLLFDTFERATNPHLHSTWDSFWWGMSTATTVAYGDIAPVTTGGKIVALFLALFGLGMLGALTAKIATTFIKESTDNH